MLQNATSLRESAPGPPNSSDEHVSCTAPATENASLQILFTCPTPAIVFEMPQNPHVLLTFDKVHNPLHLPRETTSELPKVVRTWCVLCILTSTCASRYNSVHFFDISTSKVVRSWCVLYILTSKCASRHNGVHFFDISTSKSGPKLKCFVHFDFDTCFAPQRRALFRHLNFKKWSEAAVFCTFWLGNVLRATTACTFSTSQLPKVVRSWGVLYILTWKCASRHNGVHFFDISTSKSGPKLRCFVHFDLEMCFAPQRRALFRHLNFQKRSEAEVFCTFWLGNVLRATTACTFSTSQLPKVVRSWGVLYILTWKCASRHNGVHFFDIATSKSVAKLRCFVHFDLEMCFAPQRRALFQHLNCQKWSEPGVLCTFWVANVLRATTACNFSSLIWPDGSAPAALASLLFDPPEPQIIGKTQCFATFLPFRAAGSSFLRLSLFWSSFFFSSLRRLFPSLLFICPYCRKFDF